MDRSSLKKYAWLSIGAAVATITLKTLAFLLTGSIGLLSDAAESLVNLVGAIVALIMLTIAARPADESHAHGHSKAEYFSSGIEGVLILIAAVSIAYAAIQRLMNPQPLEAVGVGLVVQRHGPGEPIGVASADPGQNRAARVLRYDRWCGQATGAVTGKKCKCVRAEGWRCKAISG